MSAAALALQRGRDNERDPLLREAFTAAHRAVCRGHDDEDGVTAALAAIAVRDYPEPPPPGVDPYGTTRMEFEDGPP